MVFFIKPIRIPLTGSNQTSMTNIKSLQAEFEALGRNCREITIISLSVEKTDYLPQLIIHKLVIGWEVHTIPKKLIITFKEMDAKTLIAKLEKANFLSDQINFNLLK